MSRRFAAPLVLALLSASLPLAADITARQRHTALVKPAVVYVRTVFSANVRFVTAKGPQVVGPVRTGGTGSGFLINPDGFLVTNAHVTEPSDDVIDQLVQSFVASVAAKAQEEAGRELTQDELRALKGKLEQAQISLVDMNGKPILSKKDVPREVTVFMKGGLAQFKEAQKGFSAEVRAVSPFEQKDISVVKISGSNFPSVKLGDSDKVQLQDPVTVLGYPGAVQRTFEKSGLFGADSQMEVTITQGTISSFKTWKDGSPVLGTDAATTHGNSGGPGVNDRGEVVGILSMGALTEQGQAFGFNYLRPINVAKDFIRSAGVEAKTSLTDERFAEGMNHFWKAQDLEAAGKGRSAREEYDVAKATLKSVLDLCPHHSDAGRYVVQAEEASSRLPKGPDWRLWGGVGAGVAAVFVLVLVLVLAARARKGTPAAPKAKPLFGGGGVFTLVAESGPLAGNRWPVGKDGIVIGRDPAVAQIVYPGDTVSREHARIQPGPKGLQVTNLSTTNPTYLNDKPVSQADLAVGDRLRVGEVVFRVVGPS